MAIESIIHEPEFGIDVQLCISDNSRTLETWSLINNKYSDISSIKYHRSLSSPSLDENVNTSVMLSTSSYVWIFGDDDLLISGSLGRILQCLRAQQPDILVLNSQSFSDTATLEISRAHPSVRSFYSVTDNNLFLRDLGGYITYVGSLLFKRKLWAEYFDEATIGTYFAHLHTICSIKTNHAAHFLSEPAIRMRLHSQTWTAAAFSIWNVNYPQIIWNLHGFSQDAKRSVIPPQPIHSPTRMIASRAYGTLSLRSWRDTIYSSKTIRIEYKLFTFVLCILPQSLLATVYALYISAFRRSQSVFFSPVLALALLRSRR